MKVTGIDAGYKAVHVGAVRHRRPGGECLGAARQLSLLLTGAGSSAGLLDAFLQPQRAKNTLHSR
jgi:hypothetical protein